MATPNSGLLATLPEDVLLDTGVLYLDSDIPFGVSTGGISFDPGITRENIDFDGKFVDVEGLDRTTQIMSKLSGKVIEASATKLAQLEPGSASQTSGSVVTITPRVAGELYASGEYVNNVRAAYRRGGGGFAIVEFPVGLITSYKIGPGSNKRAEIDIEITARQPLAAANTGVLPYVIKLADAIAGSA
jgi:hypothetical protein